MRGSLTLQILALGVGAVAMSAPTKADPISPAPLALSSQIQYSTAIQGAVDPIYAFVYNSASAGSAASPYQVTAAYGSGYSNSLGSYTGTKTADGGTGYVTLPFNLNTANAAPGNVPVQVTLTNTASGGSTSQSGQFTVLAHAGPALYLQGNIVPLSSKSVITFSCAVAAPPTANCFAEAAPTGTEAPGRGGFNPQMLGDPPGEPTAELDLDSVSSIGSPYIATSLTPFTDLPSNDDPSQSVPFQVTVLAPSYGDYDTTFLLYYSDEQDLPGADLPGSELASFNVNVDLTPTTDFWTVTTDVVPEPGTAALTLAGCGLFLLAAEIKRRRGHFVVHCQADLPASCNARKK